MAKVHEITVWARGVIMDKEGRDVINIFAEAAKMEGKHVQAFDNYEDLPDRVLVTVRKYVRLSDEEIEHKYVYGNDEPDVVVVIEPTIVKGIDILRGMQKGGTLIINTNRSIDDMLKFIPNKDLLSTIATVDADAITGVRTVDFSGSEGGVDVSGIGKGIAAPVVGAMAKVTGMVKKESLAKVVSDVSGMERGYNEVKIKKLS
ncbi:MAG: 2-oxoacid:acceptor oxidoreductase family protein [Proteobacteria bacterium]|nr:2-oxoacid:acceptor oxidoreductase family protein [Pseudomonadota bacterium]MBU2226786.1 2-oxoacid:acceptor oxidoreductase family protein [Pseudomonadota bacterium]MBU2262396.1 2-oxoacid:acceptor oxidoreductase family protein [Pseudomonadota bacterium]